MLLSKLAQRRSQKPVVLAWGVHFFTATGALWGLLALIAIVNQEWQHAFLWMGVAVLVDSFDGILARKLGVTGLTPQFDGALLDNIVDFETYVVVPALFLYEAELLPTAVSLAGIALIVLTSAFQFSQSDAKTSDHTFKGFPSYWNIVIFYLFMFDFSLWFNFAVILFCAIFVYVPIKYIYPSRMSRYRTPTFIMTGLWFVLVLLALLQYPDKVTNLLGYSLLYIVYYVGLSLYMMVKAIPKNKENPIK